MNCTRLKPLLAAYLDDACSANERSQVEGHLQTCGECSRELDQMRRLVAMLKGMPQLQAPASFASAVHSRVSAAAPTKPSLLGSLRERFSLRPVVAVAATLAVAAFVGYSAMNSAPTGQTKPTVATNDTTFIQTAKQAHTEFVVSTNSVLEPPKSEAPSAIDLGAM